MPICVSDVCTLRLVGGFGCCHIALYKWIDGWENRQEKSDRILSHLGSVKCKLKRQQHLCEHDGSLSWPQAACRTMGPFLFWSHISISMLLQGDPKGSERFLKSACGSQMSQATPTKFPMLFRHNYSKNSWKFGGHSFNYFFVHGLSVPGYWRP